MLLFLRFIDQTAVLPLHLRYRLTDLLSTFAFVLFFRKRSTVKGNLRLVLQREPEELEVLSVFREYGRYWAESADLTGFLRSNPVVESGPEFPPADPCFVGLTFHLGNFEVFGHLLQASLKSDFAVVAERLKPKLLADYFRLRRKANHIATILHDEPRALLRCLMSGSPVGVVCDRSVGGSCVETSLFEKRLCLPLSIVDFALRHRIPVYIGYCAKETKGLRIFCRRIEKNLSFNEAITQIVSILEETVRRYPYQWHVMSALT